MYLSSPGIILRQTKIDAGRKMILLFSRNYGKISCGCQQDSKGKSRSQLALKPFTHGSYQIFQGKNYYNVDKAEAIRTFFGIAEDLDKYMQASFVLELTDKLTQEEIPEPAVFDLLIEFLTELEERSRRFETLVLAYEIKLLRIKGVLPELSCCCECGKQEKLKYFSVKEGGVLCEDCFRKINDTEQDSLNFKTEFDIVKTVGYFTHNPLSAFRKIALDEKVAGELQRMIRKYMEYHLDIHSLKSESFFAGTL